MCKLSAYYTHNLQTAVCLLSTIVNNMRAAARILFAKYSLIIRIFKDRFSDDIDHNNLFIFIFFLRKKAIIG